MPKLSSLSEVTKEIVAWKGGCVYRRQESSSLFPLPPTTSPVTGEQSSSHPGAMEKIPNWTPSATIRLNMMHGPPGGRGRISPVTTIQERRVRGKGELFFTRENPGFSRSCGRTRRELVQLPGAYQSDHDKTCCKDKPGDANPAVITFLDNPAAPAGNNERDQCQACNAHDFIDGINGDLEVLPAGVILIRKLFCYRLKIHVSSSRFF